MQCEGIAIHQEAHTPKGIKVIFFFFNVGLVPLALHGYFGQILRNTPDHHFKI